MGGHVRVGFEDNIYYRKGELADSNARFVERVVRIAREVGREPASISEARAILRLPRRVSAPRTAAARRSFARGLNLWDTTLLVLGLVVGGGIFLTPSVHREGRCPRALDPGGSGSSAACSRSPAGFVYAEMGAMIPQAGRDVRLLPRGVRGAARRSSTRGSRTGSSSPGPTPPSRSASRSTCRSSSRRFRSSHVVAGPRPDHDHRGAARRGGGGPDPDSARTTSASGRAPASRDCSPR